MKQIINGKMYDTKKAEEVASSESSYSYNDGRYYKETLYKTKRGNYFMFGEGGGLSPYAEHTGWGSCYGEKLIPLTKEEAREWAEDNMYPNSYIEEFGDVEEA